MGNVVAKRGKRLTLTALALCAVVAAGWIWTRLAERAPDLDLVTIKGERIALGDLRGSPILVNFWASNCRSCIEELPALADLYRKFAPAGLKVIGIAMSYDMPSEVKSVVDRLGVPFPVALDLKGEHARAFAGVEWVPYSVLIAGDGSIVLRRLGPLDLRELTARIQALLTEV
jgi:peroxiredoxin